MKDSYWSRINTREDMRQQATSVHSYRDDYIAHKQKNMSIRCQEPAGPTFVFDNEQVKHESPHYKTDEFRLGDEEMLHYA